MTSALKLEHTTPNAKDAVEYAQVEPHSKDTYSPYLASRREWDERYGDLISRARNWRRMAFVCGVIALASVGGVIRLSIKSHVVPFVVAVDSLGRTLAAGPAEESSSSDDRIKRATVFTWIEDLRTVTTDGTSQRKSIDRVYSHIASGGQAQAFISEFYRADAPQKRVAARRSASTFDLCCRQAIALMRSSGPKRLAIFMEP